VESCSLYVGVFYLALLLCDIVLLGVCLPQYYIIRSCMLWFYVRGKDSCSFLAKACSILGGVHFLLYGLFVPEYIVVTLDIRVDAILLLLAYLVCPTARFKWDFVGWL
jgi:hypothetical protein